MKQRQKGDAMGRPNPRWLFLAHPDAKFFWGKRDISSQGEKEHGEIFSFGFSSLTEKLRSGPQQSRARRFLARRERTLDGEDRCGIIS